MLFKESEDLCSGEARHVLMQKRARVKCFGLLFYIADEKRAADLGHTDTFHHQPSASRGNVNNTSLLKITSHSFGLNGKKNEDMKT